MLWSMYGRHAQQNARACAVGVRPACLPPTLPCLRALPPCSEVSAKEKLVGYIIKNPPEEKLSKAEKK